AEGANATGGLALTATGDHTANTTATSGGQAKNGDGVGGSFAITVADNKTGARIGTGTALDLTGGASGTANQSRKSATAADVSALGLNAAVGATIALAFVDDTATATTDRSITADGAVNFAANADGASAATAKASAKGADKQKEQTQANNQTADEQIAKQ